MSEPSQITATNEPAAPSARRGSFADTVRRYSDAALDNALNIPTDLPSSSATVSPAETSPPDVLHDDPVDPSRNPNQQPTTTPIASHPSAIPSIAEVLTSPQSHSSYLLQYNKKSILIMTVSLLLLLAILPLSTLVASKLEWVHESMYGFEGIVLLILQCRFMRRKDKQFVKKWPLTFLSSMIVSSLILIAANGDTSFLTAPLIILMFSISACTEWIFEAPPRPNILSYFISCVPTALVCTTATFIPPFAVAIPGIALSDVPLLYSSWCGIGFPILSLAIRIFVMNYYSNYANIKVKNNQMQSSEVIPFLSTASFCTSLSLMFGNTMLLYLSKDVSYAFTSSTFAILTEVAGKAYSVYMILNKAKLLREMRKKASKVVGYNIDDAASEAAEKAENKNKQEELLLMFSVRLNNEIVAEKVCIILCAVVSAFFVQTPHSGATIALYAVIFFLTELIADALLIYVLVEYFAVPMLRLPAEKFEWRSGEFWNSVLEVSLVPVMGTCFFLNAFLSAKKWLATAVE
jgi:hypothetical protein